MKSEQVQDIPPVIAHRQPARSWSAPLALLAVIATLTAAHFTAGLDLPILRCQFFAATGAPCPFCGGTRALRSLAVGDVLGAFLWNPLVILGVACAAAWGLFWAAGRELRLQAVWRQVEPKFGRLALIAVSANWLFVLTQHFLQR